LESEPAANANQFAPIGEEAESNEDSFRRASSLTHRATVRENVSSPN
jgi:hypothetical protein